MTFSKFKTQQINWRFVWLCVTALLLLGFILGVLVVLLAVMSGAGDWFERIWEFVAKYCCLKTLVRAAIVDVALTSLVVGYNRIMVETYRWQRKEAQKRDSQQRAAARYATVFNR